MMPLCTNANSSFEKIGCALSVTGAPCVAQRVCATPVPPSRCVSRACASRSATTYSVTANPGTNIPELYASLPTADQFVVFESTAKSYAKYQPMGWQAAYPKNRFVHMVYGATAEQMPGI